MNVLNYLTFYRKNSAWVYDDDKFGRVAEPLVLGASELLDKIIVKQCGKGTRKPTTIIFSSTKIPDGSCGNYITGNISEGCWYELNGRKAWLCPALFDYFDSPPKQLWVKVVKVHE